MRLLRETEQTAAVEEPKMN
jgi:hypothetical protein